MATGGDVYSLGEDLGFVGDMTSTITSGIANSTNYYSSWHDAGGIHTSMPPTQPPYTPQTAIDALWQKVMEFEI